MGHAKTLTFKKRIVASATDTQVFIAPWRERRRYFVKAIYFSDKSGAANKVIMYDKDLSDASNKAPKRGNSNTPDPIMEFNVEANTDKGYSTSGSGGTRIPLEFYHGGMVINVTNASLGASTPLFIKVEVEED